MSLLIPVFALLSVSVAPDDLQARLDQLVLDMEEARVEYHVPGMTLGVVKDGEIVLVKAFGEQDLATGKSMTVETLLPIGSSTKAFTSTAIGMLVDDGKMDWDDPVQEHLPQLVLQIRTDDEEDQATIRDLLCHRTGFPRMGVLWAGAPASNDQIFEAASRAVPQASFREAFLYNNVMYLGAGEASAAAAGMPWPELIKTRILSPLEMNQTEVTSSGAISSDRLSTGYKWNTDTETFDVQQFREIETCAPAGSICSTPEDMARWVRFQLNEGMVEDRVLITGDSLDETYVPHVQMMPDMHYGLGWMLEKWNGREIIQHGGNIDGYSATVAFMPEENIGFCLLMNSMPTAMQEASKSMVWRSLLLDADSEEVIESDELEQYIGSYTANFASFKNAIMEVTAKDGTLFINVPGQMDYELTPPAEGDEKWPFKMTDAIAVSFHSDDTGDINLMKMYQGGITFEIPREGTSLPSGPLKDSEVRHLLGTYEQTNEIVNSRVDEIKLDNGWLVIDIPKQMAFKLLPPDDDGKWVFRDIDGLALSFTVTGDGSVDELIIYQSGMEFPGKRVGEAPTGTDDDVEPLPTLEEIIALRDAHGNSQLGPGEAWKIQGELIVPPSGVEGSFQLVMMDPDHWRADTEFGPFGDVSIAIDGDYGAEVGDFYEDRRLEGTELELIRLGQSLLFDNWESNFESLDVVAWSDVNGVETIQIKATPADFDQPFMLHIDPETGAVRMANIWTYAPNMGPYPMELHLGETGQFGDITWPKTWRMFSEDTGDILYNVESITRLKDVPSDMFQLKGFPALQSGS